MYTIEVYKELERIKKILEKTYREPCDIEFVVQNGKLWVTSVRIAKLTSRAKVKTTIDFFIEKIIDHNEVVNRISFEDVSSFLKPKIKNVSKLQILAKGMGVSPGITTGKLFLKSHDKRDIFCCEELRPDDYKHLGSFKGIITLKGGFTSHASIASRLMKIPCVVGLNDLVLNINKQLIKNNNAYVRSGEWITIDGTNGIVYKGKANLKETTLRDNEVLILFFKIIEEAICKNLLDKKNFGKAWLLRDFYIENVPLFQKASEKKKVVTRKYILFKQPDLEAFKSTLKKLQTIPENDQENLQYVFRGLRNSLFIQLTRQVGIGKHYLFYRPLWDPSQCIEKISENGNDAYYQIIGEEFYNVNKYIKNLIDIYNIKLIYRLKVTEKELLWYLDLGNIKGENLVSNSYSFDKGNVTINNKNVSFKKLPFIYDNLRKRQYFWTWYEQNNTNYSEIVFYLKNKINNIEKNYRLNLLAHELELLSNNKLTNTGKELINENTR